MVKPNLEIRSEESSGAVLDSEKDVTMFAKNETKKKFLNTKTQLSVDIIGDYVGWGFLTSIAGALSGAIYRGSYFLQRLADVPSLDISNEPSYIARGALIGAGVGLVIASGKTVYRLANDYRERKEVIEESKKLEEAGKWFDNLGKLEKLRRQIKKNK